jgi:sugar phosphate isomerase/epimerase
MAYLYQSVISDELCVDVKEALPIIKSWGSEYVDLRSRINGKDIEFQGGEELKELKTRLDRLGLKTAVLQSSLCKIHLPDKERQRQELEKLEGLIRASDALNCNLARSFFYWQPGAADPGLWGQLAARPDLMSRLLEMFEPVKKRALEAGLVLGFENCALPCGDALAFINALDVPGWGLAWDTGDDLHLIPREERAAHFRRCIEKTLLVHAKAASLIEDLHQKPSEDAKKYLVPWDLVLREMDAARKNVPVSVETHNPGDSRYTHEAASKRCFDLLRAVMPSAPPRSA